MADAAAAQAPSPELALLTATEAAAILGVDVKTFRRMHAPYVLAGKSRRYTRAILKDWLDRSVKRWEPKAVKPGKRRVARIPASNISPAGQAPRTGKYPSESTIVAFERAVGPRIG